MNKAIIFLYGPPGVGKTSVGKTLAANLDLPFYDLDCEIERTCGRPIPQIFESEGEAVFRQIERTQLEKQVTLGRCVVALGGGALLDPHNRSLAETAGRVLLLRVTFDTLAGRLQSTGETRPLLTGDTLKRLGDLLAKRESHYASFDTYVDANTGTPAEIAWRAQVSLGIQHLRGMDSGAGRAGQEAYDALVQPGGIANLGELFRHYGTYTKMVLVSDSNVGPLYLESAAAGLRRAGYQVSSLEIPAGEAYKTPATLATLWEAFLAAGLDRKSLVIAIGGGVVTDLAGFAASTYMRGIRWVAVPTSLLCMADASLGGKTGADLPQGKNLIGAFHAPVLVLADPNSLASLPAAELRSGLAEVAKHGLISDPHLLELCALWQGGGERPDILAEIVRRAVAVKAQVIEEDPFERGRRAALNLGHTIGHAVELASDFNLRHGEAVAIGLVLEARLAEKVAVADAGLADQIGAILSGLGLPTSIPAGLDPVAIRRAMSLDKKNSAGKVRFALPVRIGEVRLGVEVEEEKIDEIIRTGYARPEPEPARLA